MKTNHLPAAILFVVLMVHVDAAGQSGRKSPTPTPPESAKPGAEFVPDPNRDEYQLIFSKIAEAEAKRKSYSREGRWEYHAQDFSDELTRVGEQGYRLVSIAFSPRLAVMRRAEYQYEYAVVQIISRRPRFPNDPELERTYGPWAEKGFRLADYFVFADYCESSLYNLVTDTFDPTVDCNYSSQLVLERQKTAVMPQHSYKVVHVRPTFSDKKLRTELPEELNDARKTNLYPTHMLTRFQILAQSLLGTETFVDDMYETEIIREDVKKRVNELAQHGYRLILRPLFYEAGLYEAAVMHRAKDAATPASYVWLRANKLEQELARLQQQGMIYRMNHGCTTGAADSFQMVFEQPSVRDGKQREYKVLPIEIRELRNDNVGVRLSSGSNDAIQELKRLTTEGFAVRDFFGCYLSEDKRKPSRARILLERVSGERK